MEPTPIPLSSPVEETVEETYTRPAFDLWLDGEVAFESLDADDQQRARRLLAS